MFYIRMAISVYPDMQFAMALTLIVAGGIQLLKSGHRQVAYSYALLL